MSKTLFFCAGSYSYFKGPVGIKNKIDDQLRAFDNLQFNCHLVKVSFSIAALYRFSRIFLLDKPSYVYARNCGPTLILFSFVFRLCSIFTDVKTHFILEVPTPFRSKLVEIRSSQLNWFRKTISLTLNKLSPLILSIIYDRFVYVVPDKETSLYSNFTNIRIVGNSILRSYTESTASLNLSLAENKINLISVAHNSVFHGYDRLLRGMREYYDSCFLKNVEPVSIIYYCIGEGSEVLHLKKLCTNLNLESNVIFPGQIEGGNLDSYFNISHIGVGPLGLHRKKLNFHSTLKIREYIARKVPFIYSGIDPDISDEDIFCLSFPNNDEFIPFQQIIDLRDKIADVNYRLLLDHKAQSLTIENRLLTAIDFN